MGGGDVKKDDVVSPACAGLGWAGLALGCISGGGQYLGHGQGTGPSAPFQRPLALSVFFFFFQVSERTSHFGYRASQGMLPSWWVGFNRVRIGPAGLPDGSKVDT